MESAVPRVMLAVAQEDHERCFQLGFMRENPAPIVLRASLVPIPPLLSLTAALLLPALLRFQHVNSLDKADENDPLPAGYFGAGI